MERGIISGEGRASVYLQINSRRKKLREMQIVKINLRFLVREKQWSRILMSIMLSFPGLYLPLG